MEAFFITVLIIITITLGIGIMIRVKRVEIRYRMHDKREQIIGSLVWSEIIHEGSSGISRPNRRISVSDVSGILSLNEIIRPGGLWPHRSRGVISYVWLRHENGSIHLYAGVSASSYGDGSAVKIAAAAIDATAVRQDFPPPVPTEAFTIMKRNRSLPSTVKEVVDSSGSMADSISSAMNGIPAGQTAAVVLTLEPLYNGETKRLMANIIEEASISAGIAAIHGGISQSASIMVTRAMRASLIASVSLNEPQLASGLLNAATSGISTLGWQTTMKSYSRASSNAKLIARLAIGEIVLPPFIWFNVRWLIQANWRAGRKEATSDHEVGGRTSPPSDSQVVYLHPIALYEAISFPERFSSSGVDVYRDTTLSRGIPTSMEQVNYPIFWGQSGTKQFINQDLSDLHYPMYCAGAPGTGKTNFLQVIFAGVVKACIERMAGLQITPVWGETKGEGAEESWLIARVHPRAVFVDTHNPASTHRLALEGPRLSDGVSVSEVLQNISNLVSGLQFAWGDGIRSASRELLDHSIRISMLLSPDQIQFLELDGMVNINKPNIMSLAFYVLGGDNRVQPGAKLLTIQDDAIRTGDAYDDDRMHALCASIGTLSRFLDPKMRKNMEQQISSPLNKISDLRNANMAWEPNQRLDFYPQSIPAHFAPIVINMGPYRKEDGNYASISSAVARRLLLITNYLIWDAIKSNCSGWQAQGKRINLFFDEVADIAVDAQSDDVMNVLADANKEGRSRGTAYYVGCQSPAQMPYQARHSVLSSRTKFWFGLHEADDLALAVNDLASGDRQDQPYTQANIRGIPDGSCVGIMKRQSTVSPAFTLNVPYAKKWAEILLRPNVTVDDAIIEYYQWVDQHPREIQFALSQNSSAPVQYTPVSDF